MPLVRIDLLKGRSEQEITAIGGAVQRALVECLNVLQRDQFQIITEHERGLLVYNPDYLDVKRTDGIVMVQVFLSTGRTTEQKQAFYARVAAILASEAKMRPEDVMIVLVENVRENWSFGNGVAQYVVMPREQWK